LREAQIVADSELIGDAGKFTPAPKGYRGDHEACACNRREHRPNGALESSVRQNPNPIAFEAFCLSTDYGSSA
jgi:hypothetical protein